MTQRSWLAKLMPLAIALGLQWGAGSCAAGVGTIFGTPHISGTITSGALEEAKIDLTGHFENHPMTLSISPDSSPLEIMRLGLWLREQHPDIHLHGTCVGACAWFMLDSGKRLRVDKGTVIAFGMYPELWATIQTQLDRGDLGIDDERSKAFAENFKAKFPAAIWASAAEFRAGRLTQARTPEWIQRFVESTTSLVLSRMTSDDERNFNFRMDATRDGCLWWVPDAEGLAQLGLDVPQYQPADKAAAARALGVTPDTIYIGKALRDEPPEPLCKGDPTLQLTLPKM